VNTKVNIPILRIDAFPDDLQSDDSLQYHEISGARWIEKPHKHDFFLFLLFEKGSGTHTIDFVEYEVSGHQLHLLFPGQVHSWDLGNDTIASQIMVTRHVFETFANSLRYDLVLYQKHQVLKLSPAVFQLLIYEFKAIRLELTSTPMLWDIINSRCRIIAQMASRESIKIFDDFKGYHAKPVLSGYVSLVDTYFKEQRYVAFYAEKLNITPNYLNILCKKYFYDSATSVIHNRVVLEAKRLLLTSSKTIKEIAYELGFYDLAYFSKFFKSHTGIAPREFKI
jgi:AraC family transcriptional activator of pobA